MKKEYAEMNIMRKGGESEKQSSNERKKIIKEWQRRNRNQMVQLDALKK